MLQWAALLALLQARPHSAAVLRGGANERGHWQLLSLADVLDGRTSGWTGPRLDASCYFDGSKFMDAVPERREIGDSEESLSGLSVRPGFKEELERLPPITKKIYILWPDVSLVDSQTDMVKYGVRNLIDMNPDWEWKVFNESDVDDYIRPRISAQDWDLLKNLPPGLGRVVQKSDLFRLLALYCDGGYFQDVDRIYNLPFSSVLGPETRMLLPQGPANFAQDLMASSPGNPVFEMALKLNLARRRADHAARSEPSAGSVLNLGPGTYNDAVSLVIFGQMLSMYSEVRRQRMLELVQSLDPWVKTKREEWCHLIVAEMPDCKWISREPLYGEYKIGAWADADMFKKKGEGQ